MKHVLIDRDDTLARMLPFGRTRLREARPPMPHATRRPALIALATYTALAIAVIWSFGPLLKTPQTTAATGAVITDTARGQHGWAVQTGSVTFDILQLGQTVTGRFTRVSAEITYDPNATGTAGHARATIDIPSLDLGGLTAQALGPDFFDGANHTTAIFEADILHNSDGLLALGTLTLKGKKQPLSLPFTLSEETDGTRMRADITLDRRDFDVGLATLDPGMLGFDVVIHLDILANQ